MSSSEAEKNIKMERVHGNNNEGAANLVAERGTFWTEMALVTNTFETRERARTLLRSGAIPSRFDRARPRTAIPINVVAV